MLGTGLILLEDPSPGEGQRQATVWVALLFAPILPVRTLVLRGVCAPIWRALALQPRTERLELLSSRRPDWRAAARGYLKGVAALALVLAPLAVTWALLGEGSLLAPALLWLSRADWALALAGGLDAFEGALRLVLSAIWLVLALTVLDLGVWRLSRRPRGDQRAE